MSKKELSGIMSAAWRFVRIAGLSISQALKQAWQLAKLTKKMRSGIVKFYYRKVDGSLREAYGTLDERLTPKTSESNRQKNDTVQVYFDTEKSEWRCFKKLNLFTPEI